MPYGICIAAVINPKTMNGICEGPTKEYYESYLILNEKLDKIVEDGAEYIRSLNYEAYPQSKAIVKVDAAGINTVLPHAQAVKGLNWSTSINREAFFDAGKCRATTREIAKKAIGIEMSLCGKCIYVCPYTQKYIKSYI